MAEHSWVHENLDTYLAGDLTTAERENVERHVAACEACQQAAGGVARRLERLMNGLVTDARPALNLDYRIIQALGQEPVRSARRRPRLWRFVVGAAAVLVVGLVGYIAQAMSEPVGRLQMAMDVHESAGNTIKKSASAVKGISVAATPPVPTNPLVAELEKEIAAGGDRIDTTASEDARTPANRLAPNGAVVRGANKGLTADANKTLTGYTQAGTLTPDLRIPTLNNTFSLPKTGSGGGQGGTVQSLGIDGVSPQKESPQEGRFYGLGMDKAPVAGEASRPFFKPGDLDGDTKDVTKARQFPGIVGASIGPSNQFAPAFVPPTMNWGVPNGGGMGMGGMMGMAGGGAGMGGMMGVADGGGMGKGGPKGGGGGAGPGGSMPTPPASSAPSAKYFEKIADPATGITTTARGNSLQLPLAEKPGEPKTGAPEPTQQAAKKPPQAEPPLETNRKIIRTGDMEFEIDSFDKSVENITRLITAIKGGFVATINSDKLANGKMRGNVVVRMPPQYLDQFVLELRRELAKSGELKNQRIISLDVTKQYTDIESRLRAARAIEERLINIIKTGKGEIKDLVAAEKELGVWRTKIEEMEGEIRYYSNQVALSTLTITLHEKEILAPTAIVVTERVSMRLEVEDVAKAHQIAMAAVEDVKGRITKSELKQHSAGQLQSILHADIPPAKKDAFRDKLKKLGILSDHQENQQQHTEGGIGKGPDLKPRMSDVHFDVTMHNTANVRPRLTADLKVATADVPAAYARLVEEIARLKGQVRDGKLNEQDKLNINAFLDFNVPTAEKPALDKVLLDLGPVLERVNVLAPVNELSTERKFGYTLHLRDFASIAPSKSLIEIFAVTDVPAAFARLQEAVAKAKGQIGQANLNELDKLNINAEIGFTVLIEEKPAIDKLLAELGISLTRTNVQTPMNVLSTPRKFGYGVSLRDFISIPPTKATELKIATSDVPTVYAKLQEAILKAKGRVSDGKLSEQDKLHIAAHLSFTVPSEEKAAFDKLLGEVGTVLSRNNVQTPLNQLSTAKKFGYALDLRDFVNIPPSKASEVTIAASNVPGNYAKLIEAITKAKGQVRDGKLNEQDKLNVTGQIDFTVPSEQKPAIEKLLAEMGTMLSRKNVQVPETVLATDSKFGYSVVLRDYANIPARETFIASAALNDVPATFLEFQEAVGQAKGWVNVARLVEDNKAKIEAQIDFDVPTAERPAIEKLLAKTGALLSRTSSQVAATDLATDQKVGYRLSLRSCRQHSAAREDAHQVRRSRRGRQERGVQAAHPRGPGTDHRFEHRPLRERPDRRGAGVRGAVRVAGVADPPDGQAGEPADRPQRPDPGEPADHRSHHRDAVRRQSDRSRRQGARHLCPHQPQSQLPDSRHHRHDPDRRPERRVAVRDPDLLRVQAVRSDVRRQPRLEARDAKSTGCRGRSAHGERSGGEITVAAKRRKKRKRDRLTRVPFALSAFFRG